MSDETTEGRYPDAIGSLVGASREIARLTRERDEARAATVRALALADFWDASCPMDGNPAYNRIDALFAANEIRRVISGAS